MKESMRLYLKPRDEVEMRDLETEPPEKFRKSRQAFYGLQRVVIVLAASPIGNKMQGPII